MREITVRNASVFATLGKRKLDFEIRTTKDSAQGFTVIIDGVKWLDVNLVGSALKDGENYDNKPALFRIQDITSNGCL